jgi:6-phosphogluconolactonase/glucosamine-6-phosphate isomerase/deaminase
MHTVSLNTVSALKKQAQALLNYYLSQFSQNKILFLVSGGSALELVSKIKKDNLGEHITIAMLDERFSTDPAVNNFAQLKQTHFYLIAQEQGCQFIDSEIRPGESITDLATRLNFGLHAWAQNNPSRIILATLGIGSDGHTAGIFPYPDNPSRFNELFEQDQAWVMGYNAQGRHESPLRVTVTLPFLRTMVDYSIVYAVGKQKHPVIEKVINPTSSLFETPARIIQSMQHATLFTDYILPTPPTTLAPAKPSKKAAKPKKH